LIASSSASSLPEQRPPPTRRSQRLEEIAALQCLNQQPVRSATMISHRLHGPLSALAYGTVSVTITLFNKAVFAYYKYELHSITHNFPQSKRLSMFKQYIVMIDHRHLADSTFHLLSSSYKCSYVTPPPPPPSSPRDI
jgi:hypothetical protein